MPPVGAQLTYRLLSTLTLLDKKVSITTGQVYVYTVTAVTGPVMEATIKPVALIYGCSASDSNKDCAFAARAAGAKRDGDLLTIPVPGDIADGLARSGVLKSHYFLTEYRKFPVPGPKNPDDPNSAEFGAEPLFVLTNQLICDYGQFRDFFPLGKTQHLSAPCHNIFSRTQARVGNLTDQNTDEPVSVDFSYGGTGRVNLPSGDWDVHDVTLKLTPNDTARPLSRGEFEIANKLGVAVRTRFFVDALTNHITNEANSELIAYQP
jgi:hypothetical protein